MESFKEKLPILIAVIIVIILLTSTYYFLVIHKQIYYVKIDNTKLKEFSGSDDMKYEYSLIAYNENGKEKEVQFKTSRILKNNAYLELEIMQIRGVVNWREVEKNDLPEDVKEKIDREIRW